uniref:CSON002702 protein n=1 Tax=Culicoides sonorensis TaxID=179676 RepID=A0A336MM27_CULSO
MNLIKDFVKISLILVLAEIIVAVPPRDFYEDQIAEESIDNEEYFASYALPKHIFNDGKPFIVEKNPVTGQIDFNTKKTVSSSSNDITDRESETRRPSDVTKIAPNIHDFLNLPVKYSSSKSVYPLISSSYSNLKYQGNNKHYVSNHKDGATSTTTTSPKYYTNTMIVKSTSVTEIEGKATKRPIVSTSSMSPFTTRSRPITTTTTTTTQRTTHKPIFPKTSTTLKPFIFSTTNKYDTKKYQDSALLRKKTSTTSLPPFKVETAKKNNTIQLHTQLNVIPLTVKNTKAPTTISFTTPSSTTKIPTTASTSTSTSVVRFPDDTKQGPSRPITMRPTEEIKTSPSTTKAPKKAPSLSDLFSLWSDNDDEEYYDEKLDEGKPGEAINKIDFEEKKPELNFVDAPPAMLPPNFNEIEKKNVTFTTTTTTTTFKPSSTTASVSSTTPRTSSSTAVPKSDAPTTYSPKTTVKFIERTSTTYLPSPPPTKPHQTIGPHVSSMQEKHFDLQPTQTIQDQNYVNFGNIANSVPSRNTFVISPEQDSASFVLGSQQSFGTEGHFVGSSIKEPAFAPPQQQSKFPGTVINETPHHPNPDIIPQGFSIKVAPQPGVRFPGGNANQGQSPVSFENAPIVRGTIQNEINAPVPQSLALEQRPGGGSTSNNVNFPSTPADPNKKMSPQQMNIEIIKAIDEQLSAESNPNPSQVIFKDDSVPNQQNIVIPPSQDLTPPGDGHFEMPQFFERPGNGQAPPAHVYGEVHRHDQRRPHPQHQYQGQQQQQHHAQQQGQFNGQRPPMNERPPFNPEMMHGNNGKPPLRHMPPQQMGPQYRVDRIPNNNPNNRQQVIPDRMLMQDRPEAGQPLPNILPQFRPNAKVSQGHNGPKKEAGIIKVMETPGYKKIPPQGYHEHQYHSQMHIRPEYYNGKPVTGVRNRPSPTFILRRTPGSNRPVSRISPYPPSTYPEEMNPNRRHYFAGPPMNNNMHMPQHPQRYLDPNHPAFRRQLNANGQMMQPPHHLPQGVRGEQDLLNRNDHSFQRFLEERQTFPRDLSTTEKPREELNRKQGRLEPVVTLQMLHAKKLAMQEQEKNVELPVLKETVQEVPVAIETANDKKNVYVVYPLKDEEGVIPDQLLAGSIKLPSVTSTAPEYQNTPFSIANTHFEQEPILTLKEKSKPIKTTQFPYMIERPLNHKPEAEPMPVKKNSDNEFNGGIPILNTGEQSSEIMTPNKVQPISTTLTRVTPTTIQTTGPPIAFAFTPTPRPINHQGPHIYDSTSHEMYSMPNIMPQESQTEQTYFHDYDYVKEPFQAPFYASANLPNKATPSNTFEGWAIVTGTPPKFNPLYDNNKIDRVDTNVVEAETENVKSEPLKMTTTTTTTSTTSKPFDPDHFQPEFLTGFQPIYTSDTNVKQSSMLEPAPREDPFQLNFDENKSATTQKSVESMSSESNYGSSTENSKSTEDQSKVTKKPVKEIDSLEAFFDALVNYSSDDESRNLKNP